MCALSVGLRAVLAYSLLLILLNDACMNCLPFARPLQMLQDEQTGRALLIPLLRALGNIAAGGGAAAAEQLLSPQAGPALQALVTCAAVSACGCC
jgi:hypothetical protein